MINIIPILVNIMLIILNIIIRIIISYYYIIYIIILLIIIKLFKNKQHNFTIIYIHNLLNFLKYLLNSIFYFISTDIID